MNVWLLGVFHIYVLTYCGYFDKKENCIFMKILVGYPVVYLLYLFY